MTEAERQTVAEHRRRIASCKGKIERATASISRLRAKEWSCGSTPSERAKAKRARASVERLQAAVHRCEINMTTSRIIIRSLGGVVHR